MAHLAGYLHAAAAAATADGGGSGAPDAGPPLFLCEGRATSAARASARVAALAAALTRRLGVQVGDRVCLAALATDHNLEALLAVTAAGGIAALLNWRWGAAEAAGAARLVGARLLVADAACLGFALEAAAAARGTVTALLLLGPPGAYAAESLAAAPPGLAVAFAESLVGDARSASLALRSAPGGAALVVYTSGTTGAPKGVALSHAALHAQCMAKLLVCGYSADDVYLHAAPLFHIGGLCSALAMLAAGARHVFLPRFDGPALLAAVRQHGVTAFIAVPTMVADLLAAASEAGVASLPSMRRILVGGSGMPPPLCRGLAALCPAAVVHTAYGMTEGASSLTFATLWGPGGSPDGAPALGVAGSGPSGPAGGVFVGRPPPGIELAVYTPPAGDALDAAAGGAAGGGSGAGRIRLAGEGEVVTRGPHVMLGYWDDEDATAAAQLPGGWMRTGDLGCLSQGRLWLQGRAKDMIKSGGENVHAWEVERALGTHPGVALAAVVGAADWRLGEAVAAAVVLRPGWRWAGGRCQVLLGQPSGRAAAAAAVAAATAAVAIPAGRSGSGGGVDSQCSEEERQAAGFTQFTEDWRGTLLQHSASRPGSSLEAAADGGLLTAAAVETFPWRQPRLPSALQQLQGVAAGLQAAAQRGATDSSNGGGEDASSERRTVDGRALQQHCRAAGLAGFKLPRVFLLCDAAGGTPAAPAAGSTVAAASALYPSGRVVLPLNSTCKVVKHLLRQQVQQHMEAAGKAAAGGVAGSGSQRSRL